MAHRATASSGSIGNGRNTNSTEHHHASTGGKRRYGAVDTRAPKRRKLLSDAANISPAKDRPLQSFLELVTSVQCVDIFKASPPSAFVRELLANLLRLLPLAAASPEGASSFIECLQPFEDLEGFVLPGNFYRAIATAREPPPPKLSAPRGHNWKRKNERTTLGTAGGDEAAMRSLSTQPPTATVVTVVTGLQTLRDYLCMNGRDSVDCGRRTVAATLTRALLGSWDGSTVKGRKLFDQSVLMNPDRSSPVGLGLEILLQCLVQDDDDGDGGDEAKKAATDGQAERNRTYDNNSSDEASDGHYDTNRDGSDSDSDSDDGHDDEGDTGDHHRRRRRTRRTRTRTCTPVTATATATMNSWVPLSPAEETRACVTIVGNYVRADPDTSASFFRDIIPAILLTGIGAVGGGDKGCGRRQHGGRGRGRVVGPGRISRRLAEVFRSLVESTRSRDSFNVERMVVHTARAVKRWGDPAVLMSSASSSIDECDSGLNEGDDYYIDNFSMGGGYIHATPNAAGAKSNKSKKGSSDNSCSGKDKLRRRGLVLACLDILGPTPSCLALIREEMVLGETKAGLRSAVADGLLEYRRTCDTADADRVQTALLDALSSLAVDGYVGVRLSALAAIGEGCSSDCVPAVSLLLERCLDTAPKVRALAIRLLVDEFRLGVGSGGTSLAWTVVTSPRPAAGPGSRQSGCDAGRTVQAPSAAGSRNGPGGRCGGKMRVGDDDGRLEETGQGTSLLLLGRLLRHRHVLEETDGKRFPVLLKGLVETVLRGQDLLPRTVRTSTADSGVAGNPHVREGGDSGSATGVRTASSSPAPAAKQDPLLDDWCDGGGVAWENLAAPAARLYEACRPWDSALLGALDGVLGEIFDRAPDPGKAGR